MKTERHEKANFKVVLSAPNKGLPVKSSFTKECKKITCVFHDYAGRQDPQRSSAVRHATRHSKSQPYQTRHAQKTVSLST
jgi:hypothetical protein